jgi:hypothetical protein
LSHLGIEIIQTYSLLFLSSIKSRRVAQRLDIDLSVVEQFDSLFVSTQLFEPPRARDFILFNERVTLLQHRLATFKPERWTDLWKGWYAQPIWSGMLWFMVTIIALLVGGSIATVLATVLTRS